LLLHRLRSHLVVHLHYYLYRLKIRAGFAESVDVPAYGESLVELEATSNLLEVFRQLQSLEDSDSPGFEYRLSGTVAVGSLGQRLPFDYSGQLSLKPSQPPNIKSTEPIPASRKTHFFSLTRRAGSTNCATKTKMNGMARVMPP